MNTETAVLLVRVGSHIGALPLADVIETMRPLPIQSVAGAPPFVSGVSVIRGEPVTVVDVARMLDPEAMVGVRRFVTLRVGDRRVALGVQDVLGTQAVHEADLRQLPPLLSMAGGGAVAALGALDRQLLLVLDCSRTWLDRLTPSDPRSDTP